jgi:NADPH:quinone reductase-like Zn-dependent oxidoreductase
VLILDEAVFCSSYGNPEVLLLKDATVPEPGPDEVLVRVRSAGVSISDCVVRSGRIKPLMWLPFRMFVGWRGPRNAILGMELSGEIQSVGASVTQWQSGDAVCAFTGDALVPMPSTCACA